MFFFYYIKLLNELSFYKCLLIDREKRCSILLEVLYVHHFTLKKYTVNLFFYFFFHINHLITGDFINSMGAHSHKNRLRLLIDNTISEF